MDPWLSNPSCVQTHPPTQHPAVDSTHLGAQPGIFCQDAGLTWRTAGVAHLKILIFKDMVFYKQYMCSF